MSSYIYSHQRLANQVGAAVYTCKYPVAAALLLFVEKSACRPRTTLACDSSSPMKSIHCRSPTGSSLKLRLHVSVSVVLSVRCPPISMYPYGMRKVCWQWVHQSYWVGILPDAECLSNSILTCQVGIITLHLLSDAGPTVFELDGVFMMGMLGLYKHSFCRTKDRHRTGILGRTISVNATTCTDVWH